MASPNPKPVAGVLAEKENDLDKTSRAADTPETAEAGSSSESEAQPGEGGAFTLVLLDRDLRLARLARFARFRNCSGIVCTGTTGICIGATLGRLERRG